MRILPVLLLLLTLFLAGCGQKGPLFLPGEAPQDQTNQFFDGTPDADQGSQVDDSASEPEDAPQAS